MRHAPTLTFIADALPENARHLDDVLAKARALDEAAARGARARRTPARRTRTRSRASAEDGPEPTTTTR